MLRAHGLEPVLPAHGVAVFRFHAFGCEPVGPLPAQLGAEDGAVRLQPLVERRDDARAAAFILFVRKADGVVLAVGLQGTAGDPVAVPVQAGEAADVDRPEVQRCLARDHPLGQHPAGAAARGDAEGVEAGADEEVPAFRRQTQDEVTVRGEALRAVDHLLDPGGLQRRYPDYGLFDVLGEVVPVVVEQLELKVVGKVVLGPGDGILLVAAEGEAANLLLEIDAAVRVADGGDVGGQARDRLGNGVLVLDRLQRHGDAGQGADLARPLAGAVHHLLAGDEALRGLDVGDAVACHAEAGDAHALHNGGAVHTRALGQGLGDVAGAGLAVGGQVAGADQILAVKKWPHDLDLGRREQVHLHTEAAGGGGQAPILDPAVPVAGQPQAAAHLPSGLQAGLPVQILVEIDRVLQHLGNRGRRA